MSQTAEYRVSVLLRLLGPDVSSSILNGLPEKRRKSLANRLQLLESSPPTKREILEVLSEFDRLLRFAASSDVVEGGEANANEVVVDSPLNEAPLVLSEDPFEAIEQVDQPRLLAALSDESPRTVAVVLTCLQKEKAAAILGQLSSELRDGVVLQLKQRFTPSLKLLTTLLSATIAKCRTFKSQELAAAQVDSEERVAKLLRTMEQAGRAEVFAMLEEADPDACERIRSSLFSFGDIANVESRSLQVLLAEVDTATLALAVKDAPAEITSCILDNLGKRAREALTEEISLLGSVGKVELAEAEKTVVRAMIELDKVGKLEMNPT